jgi:hypothetical protein
MQLAELAASQALEEHKSSPENPDPRPPRRADPRLVFLRLSRTIRETITLKIRLAAGILPEQPRPRPQPATPPATQAASPPEDPRRPLIIRYFREAIDLTRQKRKTPITHQHIEHHVDTELAKDPQHSLNGRAVLQNICKSLELPFYANRIHADLLRPPRTPAIRPP